GRVGGAAQQGDRRGAGAAAGVRPGERDGAEAPQRPGAVPEPRRGGGVAGAGADAGGEDRAGPGGVRRQGGPAAGADRRRRGDQAEFGAEGLAGGAVPELPPGLAAGDPGPTRQPGVDPAAGPGPPAAAVTRTVSGPPGRFTSAARRRRRRSGRGTPTSRRSTARRSGRSARSRSGSGGGTRRAA